MDLSKTRYVSGLQCPKMLWMHEHRRDEFDDSVLPKARLDEGSRVGDLAMGYFGGYAEVGYSGDKSLMIAETERLLKAKTPVICEASFAYKGNFCNVDILRAKDDGVEIIEVKSSTQIKDQYLDDAAYQYFVLSSSGLNVKSVSLLYIDKDYTRKGGISLKKLFKTENCTREIKKRQKDISKNIDLFKMIAQEEAEPPLGIGPHCHHPYKCGYKAYCWKALPEDNIFTLNGGVSGLREDRKFELYRQGFVSFQDLLFSEVKLSFKERMQAETALEDFVPYTNKSKLFHFIYDLNYPVYHLDFETFSTIVPLYDGVKPNRQIPFQYSLHIQNAPHEESLHREFLAEPGRDPRRALADQLCADIPPGACVLAYNMSFEKGRIAELATDFPDLSDRLMAIHANMADLMKPFEACWYYDGNFKGSYSIKAVLPALFPKDPDLDYGKLDGIHHGGDAMAAGSLLFDPEELAKHSGEETTTLRKSLLAYCRLDTLAMVKILDRLWEFIEH